MDFEHWVYIESHMDNDLSLPEARSGMTSDSDTPDVQKGLNVPSCPRTIIRAVFMKHHGWCCTVGKCGNTRGESKKNLTGRHIMTIGVIWCTSGQSQGLIIIGTAWQRLQMQFIALISATAVLFLCFIAALMRVISARIVFVVTTRMRDAGTLSCPAHVFRMDIRAWETVQDCRNKTSSARPAGMHIKAYDTEAVPYRQQ